jgi:ribokinase
VIVVVGDVLVDVVVTTLGEHAAGSDTPARTTWRQGGAAASTAAGLARLGTPVRLVGRVGDDVPGRSVAADLAALGVDVRLAVDHDEPTGTVVALITAGAGGGAGSGDRDMYTSRGASGRLTPTDLSAGWLDGATRLHLSGYALLDEATRPAGLAALAGAVAAGLPTSVDPASAAPLAAVGAEAFLGWLPTGCLLKGNAAEAAVLTGLATPTAAVRALGLRLGEAVVTCGGDGAVWSDGHAVLTRRAGPVPVGPVDPVGAGDAFTAGLLARRLEGADVADQLRGGSAAAAAAVTRAQG